MKWQVHGMWEATADKEIQEVTVSHGPRWLSCCRHWTRSVTAPHVSCQPTETGRRNCLVRTTLCKVFKHIGVFLYFWKCTNPHLEKRHLENQSCFVIWVSWPLNPFLCTHSLVRGCDTGYTNLEHSDSFNACAFLWKSSVIILSNNNKIQKDKEALLRH